jgi:hypothetical protein
MEKAAAPWGLRLGVALKSLSIQDLRTAHSARNWRGPIRRPPCKGRPAALVASPCPHRAAVRERGEGAQRLRGVISKPFR